MSGLLPDNKYSPTISNVEPPTPGELLEDVTIWAGKNSSLLDIKVLSLEEFINLKHS